MTSEKTNKKKDETSVKVSSRQCAKGKRKLKLFLQFPPTDKKTNKKQNRTLCHKDGDVNIEISKSHQGNLTVNIETNSGTKIMDRFFRDIYYMTSLKIIDPLTLGLYGRTHPTKEILESTAIKYHLFGYLQELFNETFVFKKSGELEHHKLLQDSSTVCICVGDGKTPRTGYLIAGTTKWDVRSIDPIMDIKYTEKNWLPNLTCINKKMEDVNVDEFKGKRMIILAVHSHANLEDLWNRLNICRERICLSMLCCKGFVQTISTMTPKKIFREGEIPTDKNEIYLYHV
jgi:hypothetical protein